MLKLASNGGLLGLAFFGAYPIHQAPTHTHRAVVAGLVIR